MGRGFNMIIGHALSTKEVGEFVSNKKLWDSVAEYNKSRLNYEPDNPYIRWTMAPTKANLIQFWKESETGQDNIDIEIDCYFGSVTFYRKTIEIWFSTIFYSYTFFHDSNHTLNIIQFGRIFAKYLNTEKVLYIPESYPGPAGLIENAWDGNTIDEIINKGIKQFGLPPKGISKGRKNYFFVDYINQEIGEIIDWESEEEFWVWNKGKITFDQIKK
jgi:hypothetical protein